MTCLHPLHSQPTQQYVEHNNDYINSHVCLSNIAASNTKNTASSNTMTENNELEKMGNKQSWPDLRQYYALSSGTEKNTENLSYDSLHSSQDLTLEPSGHKSEVLLLEPTWSI